MKARPAVVCPACGALNRPTWEYCARCRESLEGARPAEAPAGTGERGDDEGARGSAVPARLVAVAAVVGLVVLGVAAWRYAARARPPYAADPSLFTIPTRPPQPPPAVMPEGPGAADFAAARRLLAAGNLAGAAERLAAAVGASPENAAYRDLYADVLWRGGQQEAALLEHAEAARLDPGLRLRYARVLDLAGRRADALREYEAVVAANPGAQVAQEELGRLLYRSGDYAKAAPYLRAAVQQRSTDPVLRQELGYALERAGLGAEASAAYREVLRQAPDAVATRALLSENLVVLGQSDEAVAVLREGLKRNPNTPALHLQMGSVLERSGRAQEAVAEYRTYARLAPNAPDAKDIAGRAAQLETARRTK